MAPPSAPLPTSTAYVPGTALLPLSAGKMHQRLLASGEGEGSLSFLSTCTWLSPSRTDSWVPTCSFQVRELYSCLDRCVHTCSIRAKRAATQPSPGRSVCTGQKHTMLDTKWPPTWAVADGRILKPTLFPFAHTCSCSWAFAKVTWMPPALVTSTTTIKEAFSFTF